MMGAIRELQDAAVEPDIWKIEGLDSREDCAQLVAVARRDGCGDVGCMILGRESNADKVVEWSRTAAGVTGFIGFAVGRTSIWDPLVALRDGKITRQEASQDIAGRHMKCMHIIT